MLMLDIGCGDTLRDGYLGVDVRPLPHVGIVCAAWEIGQHVAAGTVARIYSRHMLEHLPAARAAQALAAWRTALQPGGALEILVPDLTYHARQLLDEPDAPSAWNPRHSNRQHAIRSLYGWQAAEWDLHRWGYTAETLTAALQTAGFRQITRVPDEPWHLHLTAITRA